MQIQAHTCNRSEIAYFDSFGIVLQEIKEFIANKNIKPHIFRTRENKPIMREYFCIGFIDFQLKD